MKNIIKSLLVVVAVAAIAGGATYAYFSSTKTSAGNKFAAGTMNLGLSSSSDFSTGAANLFEATSMAPGDLTQEKTLYFKNAGSIPGKVKLDVSYTEYDTSLPNGNVPADAFAMNLWLTKGDTDSHDVIPYWTSQIISKYSGGATDALANMAIYQIPGTTSYAPTMYGLTRKTFYFDTGAGNGSDAYAWAVDELHQSTFQFELNPAVTDEYQGNGIQATLTATMAQTGATPF